MKIEVIHVNSNAIEPLNHVIRTAGSDIDIDVFCDESLLKCAKDRGVNDRLIRRFTRMFFAAADNEPDGILIACTIFSDFSELMQKFTHIPVVGIDLPAIRKAVNNGGKIGIVATTKSGGQSSLKKVEREFTKQGKKPNAEMVVVEEAMKCQKRGDRHGHDLLVANAAESLLASGCTTVLLSQVTTASAREYMSDAAKAKTLTTPEEGVRELLKQINRT